MLANSSPAQKEVGSAVRTVITMKGIGPHSEPYSTKQFARRLFSIALLVAG